MIRKKTNRKEVFLRNIRDLTDPIAGKPALASALAVMAAYASLDAPFYAPFLLLPVALAVHFFPRSVQWCVLGALVVACACHTLFGGTRNGDVYGASSTEQEMPTKACGNIEAVMPRANGTAFIIQIRYEANADTGKESFAGKEGAAAELNGARVRVTEKRDLPGLPEPGDSICYEAKWYPITDPTVPGAFNTREWLRSQGFAAYGKFVHWDSWKGKWIPERSFYDFRKWIKGRFDEYLEPAETGLLLGLLAGDRSGIPEALRNDFQRSGLVHVLAISGFHVVLLAGMLLVCLRATRLPHKAASIIAIILLAVYVPVTGGSPAVQRAVLMFAVPQIGLLFGRPANTLNSLGVALLFILLKSPQELWNTGFQLSAAATAGILIGNAYNPLKNLPDALSGLF